MTENNDELISIKTAENEYIIDDASNKIGHGISSKTLVPEKFIDHETNTVYYDCPGFKDTRSSATDIAAMYFLKKTLDHARAVKIVLTVSHSSVKSAGDRTDFINLLRHIDELINDIDKYNSSISLVVTKVEKEFKYDDYGDFPHMLDDSQMIDKVAGYLSKLKIFLGEQKNSTNIIRLVDVLLRKNGNSYENIGIFRRPSMGGKISKLRLIQEGRLRIKDVIRGTSYAETDFGDFGYTVSDKTKLDVVKWTRRFNEDFTGVIDSAAKLLENCFVSKSVEHESAQQYFTNEYALLRRKIEDVVNATVAEFSNIFLDYARRYTKDAILETIRRKSDHVAFFQLVSDEDLDLRPSMWIEPLYRLSNRLGGLKDWYDFLVDVVKKLSTYNFAKGVRKILEHPDIDVNNIIKRFLEEKLIEKEIFDKVRNVDKPEASEKYFMRLLASVLRNRTTITCSKEKLIVEGNYVFMSDVPNCSSSTVEIFCYNTLFFDSNFSRIGDSVKMFVIAPKWVVWNKQIIDLSGTDGLDLPAAKRGRDGMAGLAGTSGGSFFGIVSETINIHLLSMDVSGGNGGRGQDGGRGYDSKYVNNFTLPRTISTTEVQDIEKWYPHLKMNIESHKSGVYLIYNYSEKIYKIEDFGESGKKGFMPGPGGYGGFSGDVDINFLTEIMHLTILERKGKRGVVGKCGPGGLGSKHIVYTVRYVYQFHFYILVIVPLHKWFLLNKKEYNNPPGECNYEINPNAKNILPQSSTISLKDKLLTINDYKLHLLQHVNEVIDPKPLTDFYKQLSDSPKIHDLYDSADFVTELKNLETVTNKNPNFVPIYRSLMTRIERFASSKPLDVETKKILTYIYSSALVQINGFESPSNNALIIHLDDYFKIVKSNIAAMLSSRLEIVKYSTGLDYEQRIVSKITELTKLIDSKIIPDIPVIQSAIDVKIAKHVGEVKILQSDYNRHRNALRDQMRARQVSGVFDAFASIASCFGKIGEYIGKGISELPSLVGPSRRPNMEQPAVPSGIFTSANNAKSLITKYVKRKTEAFRDIIEEIEIETNFKHLVPQLTELKSRPIDNFDALDSLQTELDAILNALHSDRKKRSTSKKNKFKNIKKAFKLARASADIYLKYRNNVEDLENISDAIANADKTINSINEYEKYMGTFSDTLHRMVDDLSSYRLADSHLDLSRWEVQKNIRIMKRFVAESTRGFSVENDLVDLTEELQETLNALVDVYDRIEEYQKEKRIENYIQIMTSTDVRNIDVKNNTLRKTLSEIEYNIMTNLAIKQYHLAINALKQYAFPFAYKYMNEFAVPKNLRSENLDYIRSWIIQRIESLTEILSEQKTKTDPTDAFVHETSNSEPFFTWSNKKHGKLLTKLFGGEEITLNANVRKNVRNAMKFKKIRLNFTHVKNGSLTALDDYHVRLTHLGNSYYRCDDKYFVLSTDSQKLQYSYMRDENGESVSRNVILQKIEEGYYMLSPYALWNVQLIDVDGKGFSALRNLRGQVDVQLIGKGQYVTKDCDICNTNLEDYYKLDDIEEL